MLHLLALTLLARFQDPVPESAPPATQQEGKDPDKKVERVVLPRGKKPQLHMELTLANPDPLTPMLVLCHEGRSSKGEYRPVVPQLKELGYNCLAVDLSSGDTCREIRNQTARNAHDIGLVPTYLDALPDIEDALTWARANHASGKLILWGSSYSASLALHEATLHPELVDGVIAFSAGEYFSGLGKGATWIQESARSVTCPVFMTSARAEQKDWQPIFDALPAKTKVSFLPTGAGLHGTRALWEECRESGEYWGAVTAFLQASFPSSAPAPADAKGG